MIRRPRIAVFGSVHMDLIAHASHLPEKAQSGLAQRFTMELGGKGGNQAVECARLDAEVFMITQLGDDSFGHSLMATLQRHGVDCGAITIVSGKQTGASTVLSAPEGYTSLIYSGVAADMPEAEITSRIIALAPLDMVLLQLELPLHLSLAAARAAVAIGARVVLNPAPPVKEIASLLALTSLIVMNKAEASEIAGTTDATIAARELGTEVVITLGSAGCIASDGNTNWSQPAIPVDVKHTVGAGDAFLAGLCVALCKGETFETALRQASKAAAHKLSS